MRTVFFLLAICLVVLVPYVSSSYFVVYFDSGCTSALQTLSTKTGVMDPPGTCLNGDSGNSTLGICWVDTSNNQQLSLKSWKTEENCPTADTPDSTADSSGPDGGCNPVTIVSGGSTYNFYLQGSCSQIGFDEDMGTQIRDVIKAAVTQQKKMKKPKIFN